MRFKAILAAVVLAAALAAAQTNPSPPPASGTTPPTPAATPPATPGATPQTSGATPPQATNGAAAAAGAQSSSTAGRRILQAKTQEEMKAYQDAAGKTDPTLLEAAANDFAAKYPSSDLRASLYIRSMNMFAQSNNPEKMLITGRQAIAADPINPIPLVQVSNVLVEGTRDNDIDREQRLAEAARDAHAAIANIDTGLVVPGNADPERVAGAKRSILTMAYDTLGLVDMNKNDFAAAEKNLQTAIDENKADPEAVLYLRLSVAQDKLKRYQAALDSANKAVQYAKPGTPAQNLAKQQQARLQKLISADSPTGSAEAPATSPSPNPGAQPPGQSPMPTSPRAPR